MTETEEFESLVRSAADLGVKHANVPRYRSLNVILRHHRFHLLEWGEPDCSPLVLLHGGHQSAHSWDLVSLALADRFHVVALDQRGHGDSEWARDQDYAIDTMAADAFSLIEQLGMDAPIIVGHSMGGMVTMTVLKNHPGVARAAVLVDVAPEVSLEGAASIRSFVESAVEFLDVNEFVERVRGYDPFRSKEHIERTVRYNLLERADGKYVSKCDPTIVGRAADDAPRGRVSLAEAEQFACPVLVVRGQYSNILEPAAARRFADALARGELVTVGDCGHNVHSQNTVGFLHAVRPFLERHATFPV
ncbi:MAG: alpha/beta hydrolase [Chloroflexi bacterium]|nr:alpha/beta hydrolase [Chloroflexota bacterium]